MSERFSKLSSLPVDLYAEGAPVIISAGNLLKDNQTNKVLAQLKIKNISVETIKAATVLIHLQDAAGKALEAEVQHQYLDLSVECGDEFGQKNAVFLPEDSARGFSVEVTQIVFADGGTWESAGAAWEPLAAPDSLSDKLGDAELLKQYRIRFGGKCEVVPRTEKDLWLCACGTWNKRELCYFCEKSKTEQLGLDIAALKAERDARLAQEAADREAKEAADKAAAAARAKKTKTALSVAIPALVVTLALGLLWTKVLIPNAKYKNAIGLLEEGQYEDSIAAFKELEGYNDSETYIRQAEEGIRKEKRYADALALMETETVDGYQRAKKQFEVLGDYKDSRQLAEQCKEILANIDFRNYSSALDQMSKGEYKKAINLLIACDSFSDAPEKIQECYGALFSEAVELMHKMEFKEAFAGFQYLASEGYQAPEAEKYMKECNESYISMINSGTWIEVSESYPLVSYEKYVTVSSIPYRYLNNEIEFVIDYSIKKFGNHTYAYVLCGGESSEYNTTFIYKEINIKNSSVSFSVNYNDIIRGFNSKMFTSIFIELDYETSVDNSTQSSYMDGVYVRLYKDDLQKTDLYGNAF